MFLFYLLEFSPNSYCFKLAITNAFEQKALSHFMLSCISRGSPEKQNQLK